MTPVDMGITASGEMPRGPATMRCVSWHRAMPSSPVQALACPELAMIALAFPKRLRISLQTITGAALKTLSVKRPATTASRSDRMIPRSSRPWALKPAAAVPALNPRGRSLFFIVSIKNSLSAEEGTPRCSETEGSGGTARKKGRGGSPQTQTSASLLVTQIRNTA